MGFKANNFNNLSGTGLTPLLALLLLALSGSAFGATPLTWSHARFANEFWVLDNLSAWSGDGENLYRTAYRDRFGLGDDQRELLRRYAAVRLAHAKQPAREADVRAPIDARLLETPPDAADRFAMVFLQSPDEATAVSVLKLTPDERAAVLSAFKALRPNIDALLADGGYLEAAEVTLKSGAERSRMAEFIEQMKGFYGVVDEAPYVVHLLWAPPHYGQSTVWGHEVLLTVTRRTAEDPKDLASSLGVLVHELGHAFLGELPEAQRVELTNRIAFRGGLINQRHFNVVDESTQTALGNIVFMRDRFPEAFDATSFYNYEPDNRYPDAIDSLARALETPVREALSKHSRFADAFLGTVLKAQARLFGDTPFHHSHVALTLIPDRVALKHFNGLFWGVSRFGFSKAEEFAEASRKSPNITRWAILTTSDASPEEVARLEMPVAASVALGNKGACARARRRAGEGGYDLFLVGKDSDALRVLLIALSRASALPDAAPLCVPSVP